MEDAARACLDSQGWKVDPVGSVSGGSNVVIGLQAKDHEPIQVYIHPADQQPRVTGGPDDDKFWKCLAAKLGGGGGGADESAGDRGTDKGDKDKGGGDKDKGDKDHGRQRRRCVVTSLRHANPHPRLRVSCLAPRSRRLRRRRRRYSAEHSR